MFHFTRDYEGNGHTGFTGAARTTYTVYIAFRVLRQVVIVYVGYTANIKTTSRYVGSDQNIDSAFAELANNAVAFLLGQVTMNAFSHVTTFLKAFRYFVNAAFSTTKHDSQVRCVHIQ